MPIDLRAAADADFEGQAAPEQGRPSRLRFRLLISAVVLLQSLLIYQFVAQRFPLSGDDYSYLYQARLFADGRVYAQDPLYDYRNPLNHCITFCCLRDVSGRRFSKYPPGWPALLSIGARLSAPWLVQPLLAAVLTFLLLGYVAERLGARLLNVAAFLLVGCIFYAYYGASYRPHMACALCIFGAFLAYERTRDRHPLLGIAVAGSLLGASTLMRYTDWVPLGLWIAFDLARGRRARDLTAFGISFGALASGNLVWGWMLSGHPLIAPTFLGGTLGDHDRLRVSWDSFVVTAGRLAQLVWVFPAAVLIPRYWRRARASGLDPTPLMLFLGNAAVYFLYPAAVGGPGPRYLFSYFPFLVIVVLDIYARFILHGSGVDRRLWRFAVVAQLVFSVTFIATDSYLSYWRRDVDRAMAKLPNDATIRRIVLLTAGPPFIGVTDFTHNPPDLASAATLFFANCDAHDAELLQARFPGREVFTYSPPGRLERAATVH